MDVDRLRAVQAEEREADSLRSLPDTFYQEVAAYIEELRGQRARAAEGAEDPFGDEAVRRLTDEIETAEEVAEAIYERRVGKLVKRASLAAAGMPADEEGLTAEEAELFADLVAQIEAHRETVLATFDAGGSSDVPGEPTVDGETGGSAATSDDAPADHSGEATFDAREAMGGEAGASATGANDRTDDAPEPPPDVPSDAGEPEPEPDRPTGVPDAPDRDPEDVADDPADDAEESTDGGDRRDDTERVTLRITRDVGEVFGVDERTYELGAEDVVTLPAANAKPLIERDAAERIN